MKRYLIKFLPLWALVVLLGSCSEFQRIQKSDNVEQKYQAAMRYYENKDYYKAGLLFEEVIPVMRGRAEAEMAQFYLANTHFQQEQYIMSTHFFKTFTETYPRSEFAEEANYLYARSLYEESPSSRLDQTSTLQAMDAIQEFLNRYPNTERKDEANRMFDALSAKVEQKAFDNAKLYHQMRYYQAAVVAFTNFQRQFPSSRFNEEAAFLRFDAQYSLANESVMEKQRERFFDAVGFYQYLVDRYPESRYIRTAENLYEKALAQLEKNKATTTTPTTSAR